MQFRVEEFLDFCDKNSLPADFVTTHHYPIDAFGSDTDDTPTWSGWGVRRARSNI